MLKPLSNNPEEEMTREMISLPCVETRTFYSSILHQELQLFIKLPWTYEKKDATFPVLFTLDANRSFPIYSTTSLIYETPGMSTQEIVIVGIGYQVDSFPLRGLGQWAFWRTRDLTPVRSVNTEKYWSRFLSPLMEVESLEVQTGGAQQFLQAIREEIIPFIEENYRVNSADRGLAGYSFGGLFAFYALFSSPDTFKHYFMGSPSMWKAVFDVEELYAATHSDLPASLFMTAGRCEAELCVQLTQLVERLQARGYPDLEIQTHIFEGEGHASAMAAAISKALCILYYPEMLNH